MSEFELVVAVLAFVCGTLLGLFGGLAAIVCVTRLLRERRHG